MTMISRDIFEQLRESASQACTLLKVLANEDRFLILCQLTQGDRNVGQLEAALAIAQPTLSQQLGILREEKLVKTRKEGKYVYYEFASNEAAKIMDTLSTLYCRKVGTTQRVMHTPAFYTSSQISETDLEDLAHDGFGTIICLRPDGDDYAVQHSKLQQQAQSLGMKFVYFPVDKGSISKDQIARFGTLIHSECDKVLAYCRGGTVSSTLYKLWMQSRADGATPESMD